MPLALARVVFVVSGAAVISAERGFKALASGSAWFGHGWEGIQAPEPALLLDWELSKGNRVGQAPGVSTALLEAPISLPTQRCLIRCDQVNFPPGGVAYLHTHKGPGIRCLLHGRLEVSVKGRTEAFGPMEAWSESGKDPVYAAASESEPTAFVRVMVLPAEMLGKSSITYVNEEDQTKPKPQRYTMFIDRAIDNLDAQKVLPKSGH
jgi:hypothetical protein